MAAIHEAAREGDVARVRKLLRRGLLHRPADVDAQDENGWTPLHWAADGGDIAVAKLLLDQGANVNTRNRYDLTPLHEAAQKGHTEMVELLRQHGGTE